MGASKKYIRKDIIKEIDKLKNLLLDFIFNFFNLLILNCFIEYKIPKIKIKNAVSLKLNPANDNVFRVNSSGKFRDFAKKGIKSKKLEKEQKIIKDTNVKTGSIGIGYLFISDFFCLISLKIFSEILLMPMVKKK